MRYLLLICSEAPENAPAEVEPGGLTIEEWLAEVKDVRVLGERTRPASDATTVRVRGGETLLTDGPYAETKEQMAGFDVIDCANLDEAIEIAARHPMARYGMVEVRPFWQE